MDGQQVVSDVIARTLARNSLEIKSMGVNAIKPFIWASGYNMPMYSDNRMLLGSYDNRNVTTSGFSEIIRANGIEFDYILGTSLAGIAPASSLATLYNKPLIILKEGKAYQLNDYTSLSHRQLEQMGVDVIASTAPWGIHAGVTIANELKKPFIYVRPQKKDHGKQKQVEGILKPGQSVLLVDRYIYIGENYGDNAIEAIREEGGKVKYRSIIEIGEEPIIKIRGKKVLVIEDLISTGGSSLKEVQGARDLGAEANNIISIFNYNFPEAKNMFDSMAPRCNTYAIMPYNILIEEAIHANYLTPKDSLTIMEWRNDPWNWGAKHGFPREERK